MFQDNQRSSLKALSAGVSAMQEQEEIDRGHLSVLQAQVLNFTASPPQVRMPLYFISAATTIIISTTTTTTAAAAIPMAQSPFRDAAAVRRGSVTSVEPEDSSPCSQ